MLIVSIKYLPIAWALTYGKKDGDRHGTRKYCVFNRSSAVFSGKNRNIIYPILKYNTRYFIFCHVHVFFLLILRDFTVVDKLSVSFNKSSCPNRWGISLLYKLSLVMPHLSLGLEGGEGGLDLH